MEKQRMTADEMEQLFDAGDMSYLDYFNLESAHCPDIAKESVSVELPVWMIDLLDKKAKQSKISRQTIIKQLLDNQLRETTV